MPTSLRQRKEKLVKYILGIKAKTLRKWLARRAERIRWITIDDEIRGVAERIRKSGVMNVTKASDDLKAMRREEYQKFFKREMLCSSNRELTEELAIALLRALRLGPEDRLIDLGCSRGKFVLVSFLTTKVGRCKGVELSPSDVDIASERRRRCAEGTGLADFSVNDAARLEPFVCSDLRDASLDGYNVIFCAIRANKAQSMVLDMLIDRVLTHLDEEKAKGRPKKVRLILAGFGPSKVVGTRLEGRVEFVCAYGFRSDENRPEKMTPTDDENDSVQAHIPLPVACYGGDQGPRFMVEYSIE